MALRIEYSSELVQNYKQASVVNAEKKFRSVQTDEGCALFFSIGTDEVFSLVKETTGSRTGWVRTDLSSHLASFHDDKPVTSKNFAVAHNTRNKTIDLALVVTVEDQDYLYVSMGNSIADANWDTAPTWSQMRFDDPRRQGVKITITGVYIGEASKEQYVVADIARSPFDNSAFIDRYFVDPTNQFGFNRNWVQHDLPADLEPNVQTVIGRKYRERVDGLYTLGNINDTKEIIYMPLYNPFNPNVLPNPTRFIVPQTTSAIATIPSLDQKYTDLFVATEGELLYFASGDQKDGSKGVRVFSNEIFQEVQELYADSTPTKVVIWGRNRGGQIFYTTCPRDHLMNEEAWSYPLALLTGVDRLSTYVNAKGKELTFFAHLGAGRLRKAVQSSSTGLWRFSDILLPSVKESGSAHGFKSFTTRIRISDSANTPIANENLKISASDRVAVFINHLYYVLDDIPIEIATDSTGAITVIQKTETLTAHCLTVAHEGSHELINPMKNSQQKILDLDSIGKADSATVEYDNLDTEAEPLLPSGTTEADKQKLIAAISHLKQVSDSLPQDGSTSDSLLVSAESLKNVPPTNFVSLTNDKSTVAPRDLSHRSFTDAIESSAGDIVNYFENVVDGLKTAWEFVVVQAENAWHFVVTIAEKAYRFVIDSLAKVAQAVEFVFKAIAIGIKKLIEYLKFLFEWKSFVRTKDVFKNLVLVYLKSVVQDVDNLKVQFHNLLDASKSVDAWAGVEHVEWEKVDHSEKGLSFVNSLTSFTDVLSAPAMWLFEHVLSLFFQVEIPDQDDMPDEAGADSIVNQVLNTLLNEGDIFRQTISRIQTGILPQISTLPLIEVVKKLAAIVFDAFLNTAENFFDLLIDIVVQLMSWAILGMSAKIRFGFISDIFADFGIDLSFSLLDLLCMIGAIPATIAYKIATGHAPFSEDDGFSNVMINAKTVEDLRVLDNTESDPSTTLLSTNALAEDDDEVTVFTYIKLPRAVEKPTFTVGFVVAGVATLFTSALKLLDASGEAEGVTGLSTAVTVSESVTAGASFIGTLFGLPCGIENKTMKGMSEFASKMSTAVSISFSAASYKKTRKLGEGAESDAVKDKYDKVKKGFLGGLAVMSLIPRCYHFAELDKKDASGKRIAITDETRLICGDLGKVAAFAASVDKDPKSKLAIEVILGVLILFNGLLSISESVIQI